MARIEESIEINASPEKIWSLVDWNRVPEWYDSIKKVEWISKGKMEVGATVHVLSDLAGVRGEWNAEITEFVDKESVSWRTVSGSPTIIYHATINPTKNGSKITTAFDYDMPYSILGRIIDKLHFHKALEKETIRALKRMKNAAEIQCSPHRDIDNGRR